MHDYRAVLDKAVPLANKHAKALPRDVANLSEGLTSERGALPRDYLSRPEMLSAYLRYFLPWNLLRLGAVLPNLPLGPSPDLASTDSDDDRPLTVVDLGAGPLTVAQGLWLFRPDLRSRKLDIVCVDRVKRSMDAGLALLHELALRHPAPGMEADPENPLPWRVRLVAEDMAKGLGIAGKLTKGIDLLVGGNVLNEAVRGDRMPLREQVRRTILPFLSATRRTGQVLFLEPGTRWGGKCTAFARDAALDAGWRIQAPCTHGRECPMLWRGARSWCHFNATVDQAPAWLTKLSKLAGLPKERMAFSLVLAGGPDRTDGVVHGDTDEERGATFARVLSDSIGLPARGVARYSCAAVGQVLARAERSRIDALAQGDRIRYDRPDFGAKDPKTGVPEVVFEEQK